MSVLVMFALLAGLLTRLPSVMKAPTALGDGGFSVTMTEELQANHFHIPKFTAYNGDHITFCYPPVGYYALALSAQLLDLPAVKVIRYLPACFSVLCVVAFALIALELLGGNSLLPAFVATAIYAALPNSFNFLIMGGGVTRAPGMLFGMLAVVACLKWTKHRNRLHLFVCAAMIALSGCSHLEAGAFAAYSVVLFLVAQQEKLRQKLVDIAATGTLALIFSSPWWFWVVIREHGVMPLRAALSTGGSLYSLRMMADYYTLQFDNTPFLCAFIALGLLYCVIKRRIILPLWILLIIILTSRSAPVRTCVPLALLGGWGWVMVDEILRSGCRELSASLHWLPRAMTAGLTFFFFTALTIHWLINPLEMPCTLSPPAIEAMRWANDHTPPESSFAVVSKAYSWFDDFWSEWFPYYAKRRSIYTVHGTEWLPEKEFPRRRVYSKLLLKARTLGDLDHVFSMSGRVPTYLFVDTEPAAFLSPMVSELEASGKWVLRYKNEGAAIFEKTQ